MNDLESLIKPLLKGPHTSADITYRDEVACNYDTVAEAIEAGYLEDMVDWVSPEERQKAIDTDSLWTFRFYPDTPVGFYSKSAGSLEAVLEWAKGMHEET